MTTRQATCEERVQNQLDGRLEDLHTLWDLYCNDPEAYDEDLGNIYEYGLSFDYVAPDTFNDQPQGYFRYQLSWGGPSDEFRFYVNPDLTTYSIQYRFHDWFDGAGIYLTGNNFAFLKEIYDCFFHETGSTQHLYDQAVE